MTAQATEPTGASLSPNRLESLTGMRFLAALPVVMIHVGSSFFGADWLQAALGYGYLGVSFFFLLSGFVLAWSASGQPARRFWWLRFSRIWPSPALAAVSVFAVLAQRTHAAGGPARAADLLLVQSWWPNAHVYFGGNGVSWSLSCEAFFYLLFPVLAAWLQRLDPRGVAIGGAAALVTMAAAPSLGAWWGASSRLSYWLFFILPGYRLAEVVLGMLLARAVQLGLRVPRPGVASLGGGSALLVLIALLIWSQASFGWQPDRPWVALLVLPLLVLFVVTAVTVDLRSAGSWLRSRPLRWLGATSFALYLVHQPVFRITHGWGWWPRRQGVEGLVAFTGFLILAVLVAGCLHHLFERPVERRLRALPVGASRASG